MFELIMTFTFHFLQSRLELFYILQRKYLSFYYYLAESCSPNSSKQRIWMERKLVCFLFHVKIVSNIILFLFKTSSKFELCKYQKTQYQINPVYFAGVYKLVYRTFVLHITLINNCTQYLH